MRGGMMTTITGIVPGTAVADPGMAAIRMAVMAPPMVAMVILIMVATMVVVTLTMVVMVIHTMLMATRRERPVQLHHPSQRRHLPIQPIPSTEVFKLVACHTTASSVQ